MWVRLQDKEPYEAERDRSGASGKDHGDASLRVVVNKLM